MSQLFASSGQCIGQCYWTSHSIPFLPMNSHDWLSLGLTGLISLQSKRFRRAFSTTTTERHHQFFWHSVFFMVQLSCLYVTAGKILGLTIWTFVSKVISLLFNMLSRFVIAFLSRSKCLLISRLHSLTAVIFGAQDNIASTFSHSICHEVLGLDAMILFINLFFNVEFHSSFFTLLFHLIRRLFSSSPLSTIRVVSSVFLRLSLFLLVILIPAFPLSHLASHMMHST